MTESFASSQEDIRDRELVRRVVSGDDSAFGSLYDHYERWICCICTRILGNHADAEDLTQEIFIRLRENAGSFRGKSDFKTWFTRLASSLAVNELRKRKPNQVFANALFEEFEECDGEAPTAFLRQDPLLAAIADRLTIDRLLKELPPGSRMAIEMRYLEGFTRPEMAEIMSITEVDCESQVSQALASLRQLLTPPTSYVSIA